jgi:hypothetical protein
MRTLSLEGIAVDPFRAWPCGMVVMRLSPSVKITHPTSTVAAFIMVHPLIGSTDFHAR